MARLQKNTARTHAMQAYARAHGMAFEPRDTFGVHRYFGDMKLFKDGIDKHARHMVHHESGLFDHGGIFDYYYTISTGKSSYTYKQTVYFRVQNDLVLPAFQLFPERWYHRVGKWFGMQDIEVLAYPEFSKTYLLQGPQQEFIWKFFQDPDLIAHFTTYKGWSVEAVGRYFVMYYPNMLHPVDQLKSFFYIGDSLYKLLVERNQELEAFLK